MNQKSEAVKNPKGKKTGEGEDYTKEIEKVKSSISGLRTKIDDVSERLSGLAERKGAEKVKGAAEVECPECYRMVKSERMGEHIRKELEPKIRGELEPKVREELKPKIRDELEPKIRKELEGKIEPEVKEVPKLIPQSEFRKTITDRLGEYKKDKVDELKPGILEAEEILSNAGLIKSEGEE